MTKHSDQRPSNAEALANRRDYRRAAVLWSATLECGDQVAPCVLLNVCSNGVMLRLSDPIYHTTPVTLCSEHFGDLPGRVVWREGNVIGVQFEDHPTQVVGAFARAMSGSAAA